MLHVDLRDARTAAAALAVITLAAAGCGGERREASSGDNTADTTAQAAPARQATRVAQVDGFQTPEGVKYDADLDVYFVSNINGGASQKDNNGYISRLRPDGTVDSLRFIAGGTRGATLHAPKGMEIVGDTLWVADIDALRGFDKRTGAPVATVDVGRQAKFLNDVAAGPEGDLYVTDTGVLFAESGEMSHPGPDRVFRISARRVSVAVEGDTLQRPNGITWDRANGRFVIVPFGGATVMTWKPGDSVPAVLATGPAQQDGVEVLGDGRILVSSWADSSVFAVGRDGTASKVVAGVSSPGDIGFDTKRNRVAVPLLMPNQVEIWEVPAVQ